MKWFALQQGLKGHIPVIFHGEKPVSAYWKRILVPGTLREIPEHLQNATINELAAWAKSDSVLPVKQ